MEQLTLDAIPEHKITKILVSVSGGRTSTYMAWWMLTHRDEVANQIGIHVDELEMYFVFANTGCEHEDTLRFMRDAALHLGFKCIWVEGVTNPKKNVGMRHRQVDFETASRWETWRTNPDHPYLNEIKKYSVSNMKWKNCTRDLKRYPIQHYMKTLGLDEKKHYYTAIGIRKDEEKRKSSNPKARNIIYPLIDWVPTNEDTVIQHMSQYEWDLKIPRYLGNCIWCFEKCDSNLKKAYLDHPEAFEFPKEMERLYGKIGPEIQREENPDLVPGRPIFRGKRTTEVLIDSFKLADAA